MIYDLIDLLKKKKKPEVAVNLDHSNMYKDMVPPGVDKQYFNKITVQPAVDTLLWRSWFSENNIIVLFSGGKMVMYVCMYTSIKKNVVYWEDKKMNTKLHYCERR